MRKKEKHGDTATVLYKRWSSMRNRVSPKWTDRKSYYEKGITICSEWEYYSAFKKWALANGFSSELELDRKDNSKGYYPENCRWTTKRINHHNRDITVLTPIDNTETPITFVCEDLGFNKQRIETVRHRIVRGWTHNDAINTPPKSQFNRKRSDYRVIDTSTNIIYSNPKEVYDKFNFVESTFRSKLNGILKNNTSFRYLI